MPRVHWSARLCAAAGAAMCAGIAAAAASDAWTDLWSTPAQRAQHALDSGQPLAAASLFRDPKRQAHAYALAGQYARAAQLLEPFHDVDSEYNRGNALARTGQLLAALLAYNSALRQAPQDGDVRHNRDLVAQALEQQLAQDPRNGGTSGHPGAAEQRAQSSANGAGSEERAEENRAEQRSQQQAGAPNGGSAAGAGSATPDDALQARHDADLGARLKRDAPRTSQRAGTAANGEADRAGAGARAAPSAADLPPGRPQSERELALEEWLRRIPDDPGGLLRRKFLIEHIARQQGGEP
ncbi:MAG TPA: hypothetical protein VMU67_17345 [Steroidobacteraceae bacterium]|nr:hypothetical protein [Steroidobacteraceae bacterium]